MYLNIYTPIYIHMSIINIHTLYIYTIVTLSRTPPSAFRRRSAGADICIYIYIHIYIDIYLYI